ncbi:MAG: DegV family protein [Lachnospiraceae bacterium]
MVKFVADSSCDMLDMPGVCFVSVPLTIHTDNKQWTDDDTMDISDMLDTLSVYKGRSYTSCPGIEAWLTAYEGADTIYVGTLTSGLSGTYNAALAAANIYRQKHPNVQIEVFDTLSTGPELRLLMEKLVELDSEGLSFSEVCKAAHAYMKQTRLFFSFCSLHNFAQNGRVSKAVAAAVGMLGIRIVGTASPQGTIEPITKCRGDKRALNALFRRTGYYRFQQRQTANRSYTKPGTCRYLCFPGPSKIPTGRHTCLSCPWAVQLLRRTWSYFFRCRNLLTILFCFAVRIKHPGY